MIGLLGGAVGGAIGGATAEERRTTTTKNPPVKKIFWREGTESTHPQIRFRTSGYNAPFFAETKVKVAETALPECQVLTRQSMLSVHASPNPAECICTGTDDGKPDECVVRHCFADK